MLDVAEHYFDYANIPHLTLMVKLGGVSGKSADYWKDGDQLCRDYELDLPEELRPAYRELKRWRNDKAKAEGRPAYAIGRNVLLYETIKKRPTTLAELKEVDWVGEATANRYGKDILAILPNWQRFDASVRSLDGGARWFGFANILERHQERLILDTEERAPSGSNRYKRGGSWNNDAGNCTSSYRNNNSPSNTNNNLGFRLSSTHAKAQLSNSVIPASGTDSGTNNAGALLHGKQGELAQMRQMLLLNLEGEI